MRRMHPSKINQNVQALVNLAPDLEEEILQRVDQPLGIDSSLIKENIKIFKTLQELQKDESSGKYFIKSEYNRDGDSYRSPWSNQYFPKLEDALFPSPKLRDLEMKANYLFDEYRRL